MQGRKCSGSTDPGHYVKLTHVHLDHVGRTPALLAAGFRGPILCSEPSAKILPLILEEASSSASAASPRK